jgi:hypothetical protein
MRISTCDILLPPPQKQETALCCLKTYSRRLWLARSMSGRCRRCMCSEGPLPQYLCTYQ